MPPDPAAAPPIIAHAIQLAIAPVFLLTGIAGLLGVMANRLARVIDRARYLEERWATLSTRLLEAARLEVVTLEQRRSLASWAINFCTSAALFVCLVIATLFADEFFTTSLRWMAGVLFVCAMVALIGGLACFLREVYVATHSMRIDAANFDRAVAARQPAATRMTDPGSGR